MALQLFINLTIALLWMFLQNSWNPVSFFIGYIIGLIMLFVFRRFFTTRFYLKNVIAIIKLFIIFMKELVLANYSVLKVILSPKLDMKPGIFALPIKVEKDWEIATLASLITLTPGTLVVDVSEDNKILYIHAMDIPDVEEVVQDIKSTFEEAILEVSR